VGSGPEGAIENNPEHEKVVGTTRDVGPESEKGTTFFTLKGWDF